MEIEAPLEETCILLSTPLAQRRMSQLFKRAGYEPSAFLQAAEEFSVDVLQAEGSTPSDLSAAFVCSALLDLSHWGALLVFRESRLFVHWPAGMTGAAGETSARMRRALERLRGVEPSFRTDLTTSDAFAFLERGSVRLVQVSSSNSEMTDLWRRGVSTWSMPYRTREGRSTRFVVMASLDAVQVPMGLLEIGDDAPHNPVRDRALGLTAETATSQATLAEIGARLRAFRYALRPDDLPVNPRASLKTLAEMVDRIAEEGRGRHGGRAEINYRKRLTYLARFIKGELAARAGDAQGSGIADGVRAIRDIAIPRVNTEMTICGSLPPFGPVLGGKLIASMAAHPSVRSALDRPFGEITSALFDERKLNVLLPTRGALFISTKGLYSGHSAQYTGVRVPDGADGVALRKLGDTVGQTTSHLSDRTMRLAVRTLDEESGRHISREYGSGGGKRQRTLQQAAIHAGLPSQFIYALTSRPVYGVSLVDNLSRILLVNEQPVWRVEPYVRDVDPEPYETAVLALWRERWLSTAKRRSVSN